MIDKTRGNSRGNTRTLETVNVCCGFDISRGNPHLYLYRLHYLFNIQESPIRPKGKNVEIFLSVVSFGN